MSNANACGVSLTHGNPRQHIWTFAAALDETTISNSDTSKCLCISNGAPIPPGFVGDDYFCDTGSSGPIPSTSTFFPDPLWDGAGCGSTSTCCSFNTPPWFYKDVGSTTDDIEMRLCRDEDRSNEDIAIQITEIYVQ